MEKIRLVPPDPANGRVPPPPAPLFFYYYYFLAELVHQTPCAPLFVPPANC